MNTYLYAIHITDSFTGCDGEGNWLGCCSSSNPCGITEGHCHYNDDCQGHLLCGMNNCFFPFPYDADCCYEPFSSKQRIIRKFAK